MKERGRILKVRLGVNPNSSSLGSGLLVLMLGTPAVTILIFSLSTLLRASRRRKTDAKIEDPHLPL